MNEIANAPGIDTGNFKVTVSCRIPTIVRQRLENEAKENKSKSFAQYLEEILTTHGEIKQAANEVKMLNTVNPLSDENRALKSDLASITGNQDIQKLFKAYEGKSLEYKKPNGEIKSIKVNTIANIITALVETVFDK